jgi:protein phosphatase
MATKSNRSSVSTTVLLGALSDIGKKRESNQDSMCSIASPNTPEGVSAVLAVADGMGGHRGGEVASALAIRGVVNHLGTPSRSGAGFATNLRTLAESFQKIHAEVVAAGGTPETDGMGTTLSVVILKNDSLLLGHIGDSRVYRLRGSELTKLSEDHSWVADQVRQGKISVSESSSHPMRNVLTQAVGHSDRLDPFVREFDVEIGDKFLLCSDGLHSLVSSKYIQKVMADLPPDPAVRELVRKANSAGGLDNITAVIAEVVEGGDESSRSHLSAMDTVLLNGSSRGRLVKLITWPLRSLTKIPARVFRRLRNTR